MVTISQHKKLGNHHISQTVIVNIHPSTGAKACENHKIKDKSTHKKCKKHHKKKTKEEHKLSRGQEWSILSGIGGATSLPKLTKWDQQSQQWNYEPHPTTEPYVPQRPSPHPRPEPSPTPRPPHPTDEPGHRKRKGVHVMTKKQIEDYKRRMRKALAKFRERTDKLNKAINLLKDGDYEGAKDQASKVLPPKEYSEFAKVVHDARMEDWTSETIQIKLDHIVNDMKSGLVPLKPLDDDDIDKARMIKDSYKAYEADKGGKETSYFKDNLKDKFTKDTDLSTTEASVFHDNFTDKTYVAFRGTQDVKDIMEDVNAVIGNEDLSDQMPRARELVDNVIKNNPNREVELLGHSWGGHKAITIADDLGIKSTTYNPLITSESARLLEKEDHDAIRTPADPVSIRGRAEGHTREVPQTRGDPHKLENFTGDHKPVKPKSFKKVDLKKNLEKFRKRMDKLHDSVREKLEARYRDEVYFPKDDNAMEMQELLHDFEEEHGIEHEPAIEEEDVQPTIDEEEAPSAIEEEAPPLIDEMTYTDEQRRELRDRGPRLPSSGETTDVFGRPDATENVDFRPPPATSSKHAESFRDFHPNGYKVSSGETPGSIITTDAHTGESFTWDDDIVPTKIEDSAKQLTTEEKKEKLKKFLEEHAKKDKLKKTKEMERGTSTYGDSKTYQNIDDLYSSGESDPIFLENSKNGDTMVIKDNLQITPEKETAHGNLPREQADAHIKTGDWFEHDPNDIKAATGSESSPPSVVDPTTDTESFPKGLPEKITDDIKSALKPENLKDKVKTGLKESLRPKDMAKEGAKGFMYGIVGEIGSDIIDPHAATPSLKPGEKDTRTEWQQIRHAGESGAIAGSFLGPKFAGTGALASVDDLLVHQGMEKTFGTGHTSEFFGDVLAGGSSGAIFGSAAGPEGAIVGGIVGAGIGVLQGVVEETPVGKELKKGWSWLKKKL